MSLIRLLPDELVSQIAAGEVVERPASVVKELVENALDAGATRLEIDIEAGGKRRVRVSDDGCGLDRDDALLAFDRHATSKIASFADLERVATLGFRGEALASIAAVARVELTSARAAGEAARVRVEGGRVRSAEPAARSRGTTVDVSSLFFNVPARRAFLKTVPTELARCAEVVQGYALARPEVAILLRHDGRALLDAPASGAGADGLRRRIGELFGAGLEAHLAPVAGGGPRALAIGGFVGDPSTARPRRSFVFVNRRLVRDRALLAGFYRAVREEWGSDEFPALFLVLELDPASVDVNVHPQKAEVRFRDGAVAASVATALRGALARARGEVAAPVPRAPATAGIAPLAWSGLGQSAFGDPGSRIAEAAAGEWLPPPARLAEAALAPALPSPVPLSGRHAAERPLRLLGQYKGTLILLEGPEALYLVDQHVAHERILFERLRRALNDRRVATQALLEPALLELGAAEALRLAGLAGELEECGFSLTALSGAGAPVIALAAAPAALPPAEAEALLLSLARDEEDGGATAAALRGRILDALAASLACRSAVKMHHPLAAREMEVLLSELFASEQPYACPHGRPIVLRLTDADLERRFGRRG